LYAADQITGQYIDAALLNPAWQPPNGVWAPGDLLDTAAGVLVHQAGYSIQVYSLATGALLRTITDPAHQDWSNLLPGDPGQLLAIGHESGRVVCADYLTGAILWSNYLRPCLASAYDSRHRVLITLESDGKIRLYTLTPVGANLSDPVFIPADNPLQAYKIYEVRVQLTDSTGAPLPGQVVHWSLLGDPPRGALRRTQSLTAADGQAANQYFTPLNDELGPETLQARVVC
jgi:WD40 repeat protein